MNPVVKRIGGKLQRGADRARTGVDQLREILKDRQESSDAISGELQPAAGHIEEPTPKASDNYHRYGVIGAAVLVIGLGGAMLWAALAPLASAVVTSGEVVLQDYRTTIQHLDGGIIEELAVEEGQRVAEGDLLFRLDDTKARSDLAVVNNRLLAALGKQARLRAERDRLESIDFPAALTAAENATEAEEIMANQTAIFKARRQALTTDLDRRAQKIDELNEQIRGLQARLEAVESQISSYEVEVEERRGLVAEQLASKNQLRNAERRLNDLRGERGRLTAEIAGTRAQIATTRMERSLRRQEYDRQVADQLGQVQEQILDAQSRSIALRERLERTVITAPTSGSVVGLQVHSKGSVIRPGQQVMDVIPDQGRLLLDAQVPPDQINDVSIGQITRIMFPALNSRFADDIDGRVISVSADALTNEQTGQRYYLARIEITPDGMRVLQDQDFTMTPGMPATTHIVTGSRSMLDYLVEPLAEKVTYAFKEQ